MKIPRDVLVIDDEPVIGRAVSRICGCEGLSVDAAETGAEGLRLLAERSYRLILCDVMMPGVDGFRFLSEAARLGVTTPIVMATGYATAGNAVRSLAHGAADFIAKPFTADELLAVVRRGLRRPPPFVPCPPSCFRLGGVSWVKEEGEGTALIGLSDRFLKTIDGVRALELAAVNDELTQGVSCAKVSSVAGDAHPAPSPVSGRVVAVNAAAAADPAVVEKDPYFEGWLYRVVPSALQADLGNLTSCRSDRL